MSLENLLEQLNQARNQKARSRIVIEHHLNQLPQNLRALTVSAAIPHWFNARVIAALRPQYRDLPDSIYQSLVQLPLVEVLPGRGHTIHRTARALILDYLWKTQPTQYRGQSMQMAMYCREFRNQSVWRIEYFYHKALDPDWQPDDLSQQVVDWLNQFKSAETESLLKRLLEQVQAKRTSRQVAAAVYYGRGQLEYYFRNVPEAYRYYQKALDLYSRLNDQLGRAKTLAAMSHVMQALSTYYQNLSYACRDQAGNTFNSLGISIAEGSQYLQGEVQSIDPILETQDLEQIERSPAIRPTSREQELAELFSNVEQRGSGTRLGFTFQRSARFEVRQAASIVDPS
jgi:tetratricopeptide (TPR) repeat protein